MRDRRQTAMVVALSLLATSVFAIGACANSLTITAPTANAKCLFSGATPGTKDISCHATVVPDTLEGPGWSHPSGVPDGTTASWPNGNSGPSVTLRLTGLPTYNDPPGLNNGLGDFEIKAGIPDSPCGVIWKFVTVHLFFPADATNHPGAGSGTTPNWYYYWSQTSANSGTHQYWVYYSETIWDTETSAWVSRIGPDACGTYTPEQGDNKDNQLDGIDWFAYTCRHEAKHKGDNNKWFPNGYNPSIDFDESQGDLLPDSLEPSLGGTQESPLNGGPFSPDDTDTDGDQRIDCEDYVMHTQQAGDEGEADDEDWAYPGHQYPAS